MTLIESIALKVFNAMDINISSNINLTNEKYNNYNLGINKLNVTTKYPTWFYIGYSPEVQVKVNNIIQQNIDKIIQQRIYEILTQGNN